MALWLDLLSVLLISNVCWQCTANRASVGSVVLMALWERSVTLIAGLLATVPV